MYSNKAKVTQCAAEQRKRLLKQQPHEVEILPSLLRGQSTSPPQLEEGSMWWKRESKRVGWRRKKEASPRGPLQEKK